jgi:predicted metalloprotease with PDZ domain
MLVDTPALLGNPAVNTFDVAGVPHSLVSLGDHERWDLARATEDLTTLVETQQAFWGGTLPYDRYLFLNAILDTRGGLEHRSSTLMMASADQMLDEDRYQRWLGLVSHEFFHTWNAKRLRPVALGPFDYEREVYTEDLWIVEGFTSYYDDLLLKRADLLDEASYIGRLGDQISGLQTTPGRLHQPLSQASFDSWIEYYRKDDNTQNTAISYYTKGAVVAFALDATLRRATRGSRNLDDVMRLAYTRYSGERGYASEDFRAVVEEVAGIDMGPWFASAVDSAEPLDLKEALAWFGLTYVATSHDEEGWVGSALDGGNRVSSLDERGPAWASGLQIGDEVLAVDRKRVHSSDWGSLGTRHAPGDTVTVLASRRRHLREISLVLGTAPVTRRVEIDAQAEEAAHKRRSDWLSP